MDNLNSFNWFESRSPRPAFKKSDPITLSDVSRIMVDTGKVESSCDRRLRMLRQLNLTCQACTMCELGRKDAEKDNICRDPHVFSNMSSTRFVVVGQNPGWSELEKREPFVGAAGANFDTEIIKNGYSRSDFYITNIVKCWTKGNSKPLGYHIEACEPFLRMEVGLLKPKIIITLGAVAFKTLCPGNKYSECLQKITKSSYGDVYAVYHPSPLNVNDPIRRGKFNNQIGLLCAAMDRLDKNNEQKEL